MNILFSTGLKFVYHRHVRIAVETDRRGTEYGECITVEWHGEACDFNTVEDAKAWIDSELDTDYGFDPIREYGIGASRAV